MIENAKALAGVFKQAADVGGLEKPFRAAVESHLIELGAKLGIELGTGDWRLAAFWGED